MSYLSQWQLAYDDGFVSRCRAAITNQSVIFKDDGRADIAALADSILTVADAQEINTFLSMLGAAPGFADAADNGDGTVDSSQITDEEILAAVQAEYPTVAALFHTQTEGEQRDRTRPTRQVRPAHRLRRPRRPSDPARRHTAPNTARTRRRGT